MRVCSIEITCPQKTWFMDTKRWKIILCLTCQWVKTDLLNAMYLQAYLAFYPLFANAWRCLKNSVLRIASLGVIPCFLVSGIQKLHSPRGEAGGEWETSQGDIPYRDTDAFAIAWNIAIYNPTYFNSLFFHNRYQETNVPKCGVTQWLLWVVRRGGTRIGILAGCF